MSLSMPITKDQCIQTGFDFRVFCYDNQIHEFDSKFSNQQITDAEVVRKTFEKKLQQCRQEMEAQFHMDFCIKTLDFKQNTVNEIRKEAELSAMALLNEKQTYLEEIYMGQKAVLEERERHLNKKLENDREECERAAFLQRQMLAAEIEATRMRADKAHQSEIEFERLKKSLQEDIQRQRAQLEQKEQKLLSKEQELDEFIKMEVERLRKSDEIDLLHRKRELEVSESRNLVEKNALETQRRQILALQEEVSEKSVLFSQMEVSQHVLLPLKPHRMFHF
uniref:LisH domain-containing protein n=1 Tax=Mesocestoides corti TaxID=53468 RepID=A0A5K3F5I0_MESCO